jgi:hypothetical protein
MRMEFDRINEITNRYVLPTIEERTSYGYKRLDPYTKLFEERIIFLGQAIDDTVANDVMAQLLTLESMDPDRDIMIYINSPGGSFTALTAIYDTMQFVRPDIMTKLHRPRLSSLRGAVKASAWPWNILGSLFISLQVKVADRPLILKFKRAKCRECGYFWKSCSCDTQLVRRNKLRKILSGTKFLLHKRQLTMV